VPVPLGGRTVAFEVEGEIGIEMLQPVDRDRNAKHMLRKLVRAWPAERDAGVGRAPDTLRRP